MSRIARLSPIGEAYDVSMTAHVPLSLTYSYPRSRGMKLGHFQSR